MNCYEPHVFVIPEDDANRQLVNGFRLYHSLSVRRIQVLKPAGGWNKVLERFLRNEVAGMQRYAKRFMVLLIDFDGDEERLIVAKAKIPKRVAERVFILGVLTEPEALKRAGLGSYQEIGVSMARDCREDTAEVWGHALLQHNAAEPDRLREHVRPVLFPQD